jgi:hypothetical protein
MTITIGLTPDRLPTEEFHSGCQKHVAMRADAVTVPTKGVKKPKIKEMPITRASKPGAHIPLLEVRGSINQEED